MSQGTVTGEIRAIALASKVSYIVNDSRRRCRMQLGFVSAILADKTLEQVFVTARELGYTCVEVMCWRRGKADRRYAGVSHIDVTSFGPKEAAALGELAAKHSV